MLKKQTYIWVGSLVLLLALSLAIVVFVRNENSNERGEENLYTDREYHQNKDVPQADRNSDAYFLSRGKCEGDGKPQITHLPMDENDFSFILPYGMMIGGHVTPIDHQYFQPTDFHSKRDAYPVYAMADAKLVSIENRNTPRGVEYRMVFAMSCKLFYYYDLVTSLNPELEKQYGRDGFVSVKAGQEIGRIGGQTLDFAVWDMDVRLSGFVIPEHYRTETWKIHTADPLRYYSQELREKVMTKYVRTTDPVSGKIDYDIDGKLIGNWFLEGTDYSGGGVSGDYWKNHISFAPDFLDPKSVVISLGDYNGEAQQFGVKGNAPDPSEVNRETGLVQYELVQKDWADKNGKFWDRMSFVRGPQARNQSDVLGVVLVELLEDRKLKFEVFPKKKANQVSGFTAEASVYAR